MARRNTHKPWTNRHPWKTFVPMIRWRSGPDLEAIDAELQQRAEQAEAEALVGYVPAREV